MCHQAILFQLRRPAPGESALAPGQGRPGPLLSWALPGAACSLLPTEPWHAHLPPRPGRAHTQSVTCGPEGSRPGRGTGHPGAWAYRHCPLAVKGFTVHTHALSHIDTGGCYFPINTAPRYTAAVCNAHVFTCILLLYMIYM